MQLVLFFFVRQISSNKQSNSTAVFIAEYLLETPDQDGIKADYTVVFKPAEVIGNAALINYYIIHEADEILKKSIIMIGGENYTVDNSDMLGQLDKQGTFHKSNI